MLFCITTNYTPKALEAMGKNQNTNRREAAEKLVTAAGGKLIAMYGTIMDGPGAMVIFEADPAVAPALAAVAASTDTLTNVKFQRLFSDEEVRCSAKKNRTREVLYGARSITPPRRTSVHSGVMGPVCAKYSPVVASPRRQGEAVFTVVAQVRSSPKLTSQRTFQFGSEWANTGSHRFSFDSPCRHR